MVRTRATPLAVAAALVALGALALPGDPEPIRGDGVVVVSGPPPLDASPRPAPWRGTTAILRAPLAVDAPAHPAEDALTDPAGAPDDYPYREDSGAGVWAAPAEFSEAE